MKLTKRKLFFNKNKEDIISFFTTYPFGITNEQLFFRHFKFRKIASDKEILRLIFDMYKVHGGKSIIALEEMIKVNSSDLKMVERMVFHFRLMGNPRDLVSFKKIVVSCFGTIKDEVFEELCYQLNHRPKLSAKDFQAQINAEIESLVPKTSIRFTEKTFSMFLNKNHAYVGSKEIRRQYKRLLSPAVKPEGKIRAILLTPNEIAFIASLAKALGRPSSHSASTIIRSLMGLLTSGKVSIFDVISASEGNTDASVKHLCNSIDKLNLKREGI